MKSTIKREVIDGLECFIAPPAKMDDKPPLLFVHGAFTAGWIWCEHFLPWFAERNYPCYAFSLRGHGGSEGHERLEWHSIDDYVNDLLRIALEVERKEKRPPVLVGHSMGGFIIQKYLESYTAPAVALLSSVPPQGLVASQFTLMFQNPWLILEINRWLSDDGHRVNSEIFRDALFYQPVTDEKIDALLDKMQNESQRAVWDMTFFGLPNLGLVQTTPLLVLGAEFDKLVPPFLTEATARTYGVPCHIFAQTGHGLMVESNWETVATHIDDWLQQSYKAEPVKKGKAKSA